MSENLSHESIVKEVEALERTVASLRARLEGSLAQRPVPREEFLRAYA
jgi:hypothetical protein